MIGCEDKEILIFALFALISVVAIVVVAVLAVIYNSSLAIFFSQLDTGYDSPRTVLSEYYKDFNQNITKLEKGGTLITYQNSEDSAPVSNFNDTLMVYMVKYGTGQAGYVMDEEGKKYLKEILMLMEWILIFTLMSTSRETTGVREQSRHIWQMEIRMMWKSPRRGR